MKAYKIKGIIVWIIFDIYLKNLCIERFYHISLILMLITRLSIIRTYQMMIKDKVFNISVTNLMIF